MLETINDNQVEIIRELAITDPIVAQLWRLFQNGKMTWQAMLVMCIACMANRHDVLAKAYIRERTVSTRYEHWPKP